MPQARIPDAPPCGPRPAPRFPEHYVEIAELRPGWFTGRQRWQVTVRYAMTTIGRRRIVRGCQLEVDAYASRLLARVLQRESPLPTHAISVEDLEHG